MNPRDIANLMKQMMMDPCRHPVQHGVVVDVDPEAGLVKVRLEPSEDPEIITDFIRYVGPGIAHGKWRGIYLPENETEVLLLAADPDCKGYIAIGGLYNDEDLPPSGYEPGAMLWQHEDTGNKVLLDTDGMVYVGDKDGSHPLVQQPWIENTFNTHTHPHPMGPTSVPTVQWAAGDVTSKCKGA